MTVMPPAPASPSYSVSTDISAVRAIAYGWNKFTQNIWTWVLAVLVSFVLALTVVGIFVAGAMLTRGALLELDGKKPKLREFWQGINWGPAILVQIVTTVLVLVPLALAFGLTVGALSISENAVTGILAFLLFGVATVASLVLTFLTYYATFYVIDLKSAPIEALKSSVGVIRKNLGPLLVLAVLNELIVSAGAAALYLGLFVAYPVYLIAAAYSFRVVTTGTIAPDRQLPAQPPVPPPFTGGFVEPDDNDDPGLTKVIRFSPPPPGGQFPTM